MTLARGRKRESPGSIISRITGHRNGELKRYQHLSSLFKQQTVELIAQELANTDKYWGSVNNVDY